MSYYTVVFLMLAAELVSGLSFNLTHQRVGNMFYLTCLTQNSSLNNPEVQFWINETERINITSTSDRVSLIYNIIATNWSQSLRALSTVVRWMENGAMDWDHLQVHKNSNGLSGITTAASDDYVNWFTDSRLPSLTIQSFNKDHTGVYYCHVTVTDPYSGEVWEESERFNLSYFWPDWFIAFWVVLLTIVALPMLVACCCCCIRGPRIPINRVIERNLRCYQRCKKKVKGMKQTPRHRDLTIYKNQNIGNGAFGSVFRGKYKGQPCAAKLLTHHAQEMATGGIYGTTAGIQTAALEAFRKECNFLETLHHTNIVNHLTNLTEPNSQLPILIMELMDCNLKQYLQGKQTLSRLCQLSLCLDIAKGLEFLHSQEVIHRDLCDVNILLSLTGCDYPKAKVADFGMSRILPHDYISATLSGLAHRVVYLPSEAREYPYHYTYSLDIYSFGVIAVQIVQGKLFLRSKSEVESALADISESHSLKCTIQSCLSQNHTERPLAKDIVNTINCTHDTTVL